MVTEIIAGKSSSVNIFARYIDQPIWFLGQVSYNQKGKKELYPLLAYSGTYCKRDAALTTYPVVKYALTHLFPGNNDYVIVLVIQPGLNVLDLDHCRDKTTGQIDQWAQDIRDHFPTYCDVSLSETGIHSFVLADIDGPKSSKPIEGAHPDAKLEFLTPGNTVIFTGNHLPGTPDHLASLQDKAQALYASLSKGKPTGKTSTNTQGTPDEWHIEDIPSRFPSFDRSDKEVLSICEKKENFLSLYAGKWETIPGYRRTSRRYSSSSEARYGLLAILYRESRDLQQVDRLFHQSGFFRTYEIKNTNAH